MGDSMSLVLPGATSGSVTIDVPAVAGTNALTLPALTGTILTNKTAGTILQVVNAVKTDTFTTSSTSDVAITGLSASITPSSTSSKILVLINIGATSTTTNDYGVYLSIYRSSSVISGAIGNAAGSRKVCTSAARYSDKARFGSSSIMYLDSPSSTSALTYAGYVSMELGGGNACINRNGLDDDNAFNPRTISTITLLEIAG